MAGMALILLIVVGAIIVALGIALAPYVLPFLVGVLQVGFVAGYFIFKWVLPPVMALVAPSLLAVYAGMYLCGGAMLALRLARQPKRVAAIEAFMESDKYRRVAIAVGAPFGVVFCVWVVNEMVQGRWNP